MCIPTYYDVLMYRSLIYSIEHFKLLLNKLLHTNFLSCNICNKTYSTCLLGDNGLSERVGCFSMNCSDCDVVFPPVLNQGDDVTSSGSLNFVLHRLLDDQAAISNANNLVAYNIFEQQRKPNRWRYPRYYNRRCIFVRSQRHSPNWASCLKKSIDQKK